MITSAEARLGKTMALVASIGTVVTFIIWVGPIGLNYAGYHPQFGALSDGVGFIQSFGFVFTVALSMKLFGDDEKPYFRVVSQIVLVAAIVSLLNSLSATANAKSAFPVVFDPSQVLAISNIAQFGFFVMAGLWALTVLRADGDGLLPSWGAIAGRGAGWLILVVQLGSWIGVLPATVLEPLYILGGIILWPIFVFGISQAFGKKV